jgi:hypothetical protein
MAQGVEDAINEELWTDSFCDETIDDHVARFCLVLGLPTEAAERCRDLPDPRDDDPDDDDAPERMSSG